MAVNLADFYKKGVIDAVEEFEKTAVFQEFMKDDSFREAFTRRIAEKIQDRKSLESNPGG